MNMRPTKIIGAAETVLRKVLDLVLRYLGPNGDLQILAVVVSLVIFSLIRTTIGHPETFTAPVIATVNVDGVAVLSQSPNEVKIRLKGPEEEINKFDPTGLKVKVDIRSVPDSRQKMIPLKLRYVVGNGKLRVVGIEPSEIEVVYDREIEMDMYLMPPSLIGRPLQGEAGVELETKTVRVKGPESQLQKLKDNGIKIPTDVVDVEGKTQDFSKSVRVKPPDDSGISSFTPSEVEVKVSIVNIPLAEPLYMAPSPSSDKTLLPFSAHNAATRYEESAAEGYKNSSRFSGNAEGHGRE